MKSLRKDYEEMMATIKSGEEIYPTIRLMVALIKRIIDKIEPIETTTSEGTNETI